MCLITDNFLKGVPLCVAGAYPAFCNGGAKKSFHYDDNDNCH